MAGEVTSNSAILQTRLTKYYNYAKDNIVGDDAIDIAGVRGYARFELSRDQNFSNSFMTEIRETHENQDYIIKQGVFNLQSDTVYYYRTLYGSSKEKMEKGATGSFKTLKGKDRSGPVAFSVFSCANYYSFHGKSVYGFSYTGHDRHFGPPGFEAISRMNPDFIIGQGDTVYYDSPPSKAALNIFDMRKRWRLTMAQPRMKELLGKTASYWQKDDHDYRYNDGYPSQKLAQKGYPMRDLPISHEDGIRVFREQVPVVYPNSPNPRTYRTHRISRELQIWLVEGRDFRSANDAPDDKNKTIWGFEQRDWLMRTLKESDAKLKILFSPTPIIGPVENTGKRDNHANIGGFQYERDMFMNWLKANNLTSPRFFIMCGDSHWPYHSTHPFGIEEFCCGALSEGNQTSFIPISGTSNSIDMEGKIKQLYVPDKATTSFIKVEIKPVSGSRIDVAFSIYDSLGKQLYHVARNIA